MSDNEQNKMKIQHQEKKNSVELTKKKWKKKSIFKKIQIAQNH